MYYVLKIIFMNKLKISSRLKKLFTLECVHPLRGNSPNFAILEIREEKKKSADLINSMIFC